MTLSIQDLVRRRTDVETYLHKESEFASNDKRAQKSRFWQDLLDQRQNLLSLNELLVFLRSKNQMGIASDHQNTLEDSRRYFLNELKMVLQYTPADFIKSVPESSFGSPTVFEYEGIFHSSTFVMNVGTLWSCKQFIDRYLSSKSSLSVMEIGAGYGGVSYQLQSTMLKVSSYTICDIPENLFLSSLFLQNSFSSKKVSLITHELVEKKTSIEPNSLNFTVPQNLDAIDSKFDLFINTFSFQEMDADSVHEYIKWVRAHLADDGICYLINTHNKVGIKKASDYGYQHFNILHLKMFRKSPGTYFNTIPYEVVLGHPSTRTKNFEPAVLDSLCELMQLGIGEDIQDECDQFVGGKISSENGAFISGALRIFQAGTLAEKEVLVSSLSATSTKQKALKSYIAGVVSFVAEKDGQAGKFFQQALDEGLSDFARARAMTTMLLLNKKSSFLPKGTEENFLREIRTLTPNLVEEVDRFFKEAGNLQFHRRDFAQRLHLNYDIPLADKILRKIKQAF